MNEEFFKLILSDEVEAAGNEAIEVCGMALLPLLTALDQEHMLAVLLRIYTAGLTAALSQFKKQEHRVAALTYIITHLMEEMEMKEMHVINPDSDDDGPLGLVH
jgi:hypothetical protein